MAPTATRDAAAHGNPNCDGGADRNADAAAHGNPNCDGGADRDSNPSAYGYRDGDHRPHGYCDGHY